MATFWVVTSYNNDDNYDADLIAIFLTKQAAIAKVIELISREYDGLESEELCELLEDWNGIRSNEPTSWVELRKVVDKKLNLHGECSGLDVLNYKIKQHVVSG